MIHYLTAARNAPLMQAYVSTWGQALARRIVIVPYERLFAARTVHLPVGTYIFTSIGQSLGSRNPPSAARQRAITLHEALVGRCGRERVLNDPVKSLRRFDLLKMLSDSGLNRFRAHRAQDVDSAVRFPVFLRAELGTVWKAPPLIGTREALDAQLRVSPPRGLLAIEFCNTADARGVYRKYGCFVVGDRIVPRHLFLSRDWLVKSADMVDAAALEEEIAFLETNPHAEALRRVCRMADISYGRIDYAMLDGVPQVWEINTTPQIVTAPDEDPPQRRPVHEKFAAAFRAALDALDPPAA